MTPPADLHQLGNGDFIWQAYDPAVKADLFSTGLKLPVGTCLIDPISFAGGELMEALAGSTVCGIVVTNANHARAAASLRQQLSAPIYARVGAENGLPGIAVTELAAGATQLAGLDIVAIDGAADGEIALFRADSMGGTVVVGDAVINSGSYGFTLLPAKYCTNPKLLRRSLRQLIDRPFERLFFAHGMPILSGAQSRLAELLNANS